MANGSVTSTGIEEMRAAIQQLPSAVTAALKQVAQQTAHREQSTARSALRSRQKTDAHALADNIEIVEDTEKKQFSVISKAPEGQPENVPTWNEYRTIYMGARPYMRPAEDAEREGYRAAQEAASLAAANSVLGK